MNIRNGYMGVVSTHGSTPKMDGLIGKSENEMDEN